MGVASFSWANGGVGVNLLPETCETPLQKIHLLDKISTEVAGGDLVVGNIKRMLEALERGGATPQQIKNIEKIFDDVRHPVLSQTIDRLLDHENKGDLVFCAMSKHCHFLGSGAGGAAARYIHDNYEPEYQLVSFGRSQMMDKSDEEIRLTMNQPAIHSYLAQVKESRAPSRVYIKANPLVEVSSSVLAGTQVSGLEDEFFHEVTHYADHHLFREWVLANLNLERMGLGVDRLYRRFTRRVGEQLFVSDEFQLFFTETRAYSVTGYIVGLKNPDLAAREIRGLLSQALAAILVHSGAGDVVEFFRKRSSMPPEDLLLFGDGPERPSLEMQVTIDLYRAFLN
jgi:hypothetical protein